MSVKSNPGFGCVCVCVCVVFEANEAKAAQSKVAEAEAKAEAQVIEEPFAGYLQSILNEHKPARDQIKRIPFTLALDLRCAEAEAEG